MEHSRRSNSEERSNESDRIDETIEVRRVAENGEDDNESQDLDVDPFENEALEPEENSELQRRSHSQDSEEHIRSLFEENNVMEENEDRNDSGEVSESGNTHTLYFSQQETIISPSDSTWQTPEEDKEEVVKDQKMQLTPAKLGKMERTHSSPARPLTEMEEFRASNEFLHLESAAMTAGDILLKFNGKLDLDSIDGHSICKTFLSQIEALATSFKIKSIKRNYRKKFSQTYKVLYKEGSLCYLIEILDSAQEGKI